MFLRSVKLESDFAKIWLENEVKMNQIKQLTVDQLNLDSYIK